MTETSKPSIRKPHARRNLAILAVGIVVILSIIAFAYHMYNEDVREKQEVLSPQQRWIILDANYDGDHTSITLKYLGENRVETWVSGNSYVSGTSIIWLETEELGTVRKGYTATVKILGYTYYLTIDFGRERVFENKAVFDVLPKEDFEG